MKYLAGISLSLLASTAVAADICGTSGYDKGSPSSYSTDTTANTPQLCSARCKSDSQCKSFVVGGGICNLYTAAVENNLNADPERVASPTRSPYYFYDVGCTIASDAAPLTYDTSKPVCGVRGYDVGSPRSYFYDGSQSAESCSKVCSAAGGKCNGFATESDLFTRRPTGCWLYTSIKDNFYASNLINGPQKAYYFYDMACYPNLAPSSSAVNPSSAPATTPTTTAVTPPAATTAPAANAICGGQGYDKGSPSAYASSSGATLDSCKASCKSDSKCQGIVFGDSTCLLYASAFANNFAAESLSIWRFYDATCFANVATPVTTLQTITRTSSSAPAATSAKLTCNLNGYETTSASDSIVGFKYKPTGGCKSFCKGKSAISYEQYYDYCVCFSRSAYDVSAWWTSSPVVFNDINC